MIKFHDSKFNIQNSTFFKTGERNREKNWELKTGKSTKLEWAGKQASGEMFCQPMI
jgi:hypothetical protein